MAEKFTPPKHVNFLAQKLYGNLGEIADVSVAEIGKDGGGPVGNHTHRHDHLFTVLSGEAKIIIGEKEIILGEGETFLVDGSKPHSVWNNTDSQTVMLGINIISNVDSPEKCESIGDVRSAIDGIDDEIIKLIAKRDRFVKRAADFKKSESDVKAPDRVEAVIGKVRERSVSYGADPDMTEKLYREMINGFIGKEMNEFNGKKD